MRHAGNVDDAAREAALSRYHSVAGSGRYSAIRRISLAVFSDTCGNLIQIYQPPGA